MSQDRELLELAAKAAGYRLTWYEGTDKHAAVRLAIVRFAAEIGRNMK